MRSTIVFIGGTTFFASVRKFTKEVGRSVYGYFRERRQNRIQGALEELMLHRNAIQNRRREYRNHLLKRRDESSKILKKHYEDGLTAARNRIHGEWFECIKRWEFLKKHHALPFDPLTGKRWENLSEFLKAVDTIEKIYA